MGKSCGTCRFWDKQGFLRKYGADASGMGEVGICRCGSPTPTPPFIKVVGVAMSANWESDPFCWGMWPDVNHDEWCGKWEQGAP